MNQKTSYYDPEAGKGGIASRAFVAPQYETASVDTPASEYPWKPLTPEQTPDTSTPLFNPSQARMPTTEENAARMGLTIPGSAVVPEAKPSVDWQGVGSQVTRKALSAIGTKTADAEAGYKKQLEESQETRGYWLDPKNNVKPDISGYLATIPSKREAISKGTLTGGAFSKTETGDIAAQVLSPFGAIAEQVGGKEWKGSAEYIGNKMGEGALSGLATGGWVGALVGAGIGVIEGVWGWNDALETDKKNKETALAEYQRALTSWRSAQNAAASARYKALRDKQATDAYNTSQLGQTRRDQMRQLIIDLTGAGKKREFVAPQYRR